MMLRLADRATSSLRRVLRWSEYPARRWATSTEPNAQMQARRQEHSVAAFQARTRSGTVL